jgi:hypothetical protein
MATTYLESVDCNSSGRDFTASNANLVTGTDVVFRNDGRTTVVVRKVGGTGNSTFTVVTPAKVDGNAIANVTITVVKDDPIGTWAGPFPVAEYNEQYSNSGDLIPCVRLQTSSADTLVVKAVRLV